MKYQNTVPIKSAWASKINWGALVAAAAMILANFGIDLDEETQNAVLTFIISGLAMYTWFVRTFFTKSLTKGSADL